MMNAQTPEARSSEARPPEALTRMEADKVIAAYRRWAPIYDHTFGRITRAGRLAAVERINALPAGKVLEVGVGTGIALPRYDGHNVTGIDLSRDMLKVARARVVREGLDHVDAIEEMDAGDMSFEDGAFDVVTAMFVMTVVPDPHAVMAELARVCRPGGHVVVLNHFSKEECDDGALARTERLFAPLGDRLGWRPVFPLETVVEPGGTAADGRLKLLRLDPIRPASLFTLLTFERV